MKLKLYLPRVPLLVAQQVVFLQYDGSIYRGVEGTTKTTVPKLRGSSAQDELDVDVGADHDDEEKYTALDGADEVVFGNTGPLAGSGTTTAAFRLDAAGDHHLAFLEQNQVHFSQQLQQREEAWQDVKDWLGRKKEWVMEHYRDTKEWVKEHMGMHNRTETLTRFFSKLASQKSVQWTTTIKMMKDLNVTFGGLNLAAYGAMAAMNFPPVSLGALGKYAGKFLPAGLAKYIDKGIELLQKPSPPKKRGICRTKRTYFSGNPNPKCMEAGFGPADMSPGRVLLAAVEDHIPFLKAVEGDEEFTDDLEKIRYTPCRLPKGMNKEAGAGDRCEGRSEVPAWEPAGTEQETEETKELRAECCVFLRLGTSDMLSDLRRIKDRIHAFDTSKIDDEAAAELGLAKKPEEGSDEAKNLNHFRLFEFFGIAWVFFEHFMPDYATAGLDALIALLPPPLNTLSSVAETAADIFTPYFMERAEGWAVRWRREKKLVLDPAADPEDPAADPETDDEHHRELEEKEASHAEEAAKADGKTGSS
ncbi:unnamed protein product [Amoebophrya sp. A120]|nr:unnamed protein product [Amoebophrya sp. A120]|eukprot:GSA120T00023977001.1